MGLIDEQLTERAASLAGEPEAIRFGKSWLDVLRERSGVELGGLSPEGRNRLLAEVPTH